MKKQILTHTILVIFASITCLSACVPVGDTIIKEPIQTDTNKRSLGTFVDDEKLENIIGINLRKTSKELEKSRIVVKCFNGSVLLAGEVLSQELKDEAGRVALAVKRVKVVHNELEVRAKSQFMSRVNDDWIANKMRLELIKKKDFDSSRVKVLVENRVVYLMGFVNQTEANDISKRAAGIKGVEKVVRVFDYVTE